MSRKYYYINGEGTNTRAYGTDRGDEAQAGCKRAVRNHSHSRCLSLSLSLTAFLCVPMRARQFLNV